MGKLSTNIKEQVIFKHYTNKIEYAAKFYIHIKLPQRHYSVKYIVLTHLLFIMCQ